MNIVFAYENIIVGGCELLIYKLAKYSILIGDCPIVFCRTIDHEMKDKFDSDGIKIITVRQWNRPNIYDIDREGIIITFLPFDYFRYADLSPDYNVILYAVHYKALKISSSNRILNKFYKLFFGKIIKDLIINNQLVCMDEQTSDYTNNYYRWNEYIKPKIIRIPIDQVNQSEYIISDRYYSKDRNILTIARAEFPFKGYLIGLIRIFPEFLRYFNNLTLTIISYGNDEQKIIDEVNKLPREIGCRIKLVGKTDYNELSKYYNECYVYIGMGTTILDASQRYIPSIAVQAYTYDIIAGHYFYDKCSEIAYSGPSNNIYDLLYSILNSGYSEYVSKSKRSRESVINNYNIASCYRGLTNMQKIVHRRLFSVRAIQLMLRWKTILNN